MFFKKIIILMIIARGIAPKSIYGIPNADIIKNYLIKIKVLPENLIDKM